MISGAPTIFKSNYQRTVALSSAEAEYMAQSLCTQEVVWARLMLKDMVTSNNAGFIARTKHVDFKHHFIRENVARDVIEVNYIPTKDLLAGILTIRLGTKCLQYLMHASGVLTKAAQH
ncbi:polyprotein [Phytophthora megakarya]|uniref:Polyprotein n=1 Tax=Phytophthora megakarya TaxID=4795 RepID=A0A225W8A1_9STRA|nr:polyprotein [Phytophthora megakarya]